MNYQDFSMLKVGDMVKVKCPYCIDPHYYVGRVTDKILRYSYPGFRGTCKEELVIKTDIPGLGGAKINVFDIVRKLPKPEKRTAYWCKTMDDAKNFLEDCEAWGIKWAGGQEVFKMPFWRLDTEGIMFYLRGKNSVNVKGDCCMTWNGRDTKELTIYEYMDSTIDRYIEYPSGKVLWDRAEEEAKKKAEEEAKKRDKKLMNALFGSRNKFMVQPRCGRAYLCKTPAEAKRFLMDCEIWDIKWKDGEKATQWDGYEDSTFDADESVVFYVLKTGLTYDNATNFNRCDEAVDLLVEYPSGNLIWDTAVERKLRNKTKVEPVSFKVRCVWAKKGYTDFTVGKIYEWKDGGLTDDTGFTFRSLCRSSDIDKWKFGGYKFVKVTEEELKAEEKCAEAIRNLGKVATLGSEIITGYQEAWTKFAKMYADTDSVKCCKKSCGCACTCANFKPEIRSGSYPWGVKEVKRSAKVGEYIKIVTPWCPGYPNSRYSIGDIGKVVEVGCRLHACIVSINGHERAEVAHREYVVLENYVPEVKEVDRRAVKGEYIKIVKAWHTSSSEGKYTDGDIGLVTRGYNNGAIRVNINGHEGVPVSDTLREYVVLENYKA